mgnify:CR=1 FL=1
MLFRSHVPFANLAPAPPSPAHSEFASTNTLTAEERRDHVRRTRKLQNLLGSPLDERTLRGRSLDVSRPTGRRHSIPPPSPTSPHEFDFGRPVGLGSSVSMARSSSSPIPLTPSTESFRPAIPNASSFSALGGTPELVREERRRKLAKVQRLLGEKVPAHLALNDEVGGRMGSVGRKGIRGRLKGALGIGRRGSKGSETREQWFERAETTRVVEMEMDREESSVARETTSQIAPVGPVKGMAKARKLEQVRSFLLFSCNLAKSTHSSSGTSRPPLSTSPVPKCRTSAPSPTSPPSTPSRANLALSPPLPLSPATAPRSPASSTSSSATRTHWTISHASTLANRTSGLCAPNPRGEKPTRLPAPRTTRSRSRIRTRRSRWTTFRRRCSRRRVRLSRPSRSAGRRSPRSENRRSGTRRRRRRRETGWRLRGACPRRGWARARPRRDPSSGRSRRRRSSLPFSGLREVRCVVSCAFLDRRSLIRTAGLGNAAG